MEQTLTVKALKELIAESSNEFKAVLGAGVESENKSNNGKAYSDAKKRAKDYDGGLSKDVEIAKYEKSDGNKTTLDYNPENASEDYKKRVHAQVKGYSSVQEMENDIEKIGDFDDNDKIYQELKKSGQEMHDNEESFKKTGLQANKMPKDTFKKEEMYESRDGFDMRNLINTLKESSSRIEQKKEFTAKPSVKTVFFKKTSFLNEGHMISRIPDEFKNEGTQFKMKDKHGTEYLIEWYNGKANVINCEHKQKINETLTAYEKLSSYNGEEYNTMNGKAKINEGSAEINRMLDIVRKITNEKK
jgi:hypothetical protein